MQNITLVGAKTNHPILTADRRIELDSRRPEALQFVLSAPEGAYDAVAISVADIQISGGKGSSPTRDGKARIPLKLTIRRARPVRLLARIDLDALAHGAELGRALEIQVDRSVPEQTFEMPRDERATFRFRVPSLASVVEVTAGLDLPAGAFPPGTRVVVRLPEPDGLPALFRGQQIVGAIVEIAAAAALNGAVEVTVPYDAGRVAAAGVTPDRLVVMHLDDRRRHYRELRPTRVDTGARTLTVRTDSFSTFFACTAGIEIHEPELRADGWGRVLGFCLAPVATVAGRTSDTSAHVVLQRPAGAAGWAGFGWFDFEDIPLAAGDTPVSLEATVDGLVPHSCEFAIRHTVPPQRITGPSRHYGLDLIVSENDVPIASAVVVQGRNFGEDIFEPIAAWQRSFQRYGPYVYQPSADRTSWEWRTATPLLPETHFEEQAARVAIPAIEALIPVPINAGAREDVRALASLADRLNGVPEDDALRRLVYQVLGFAAAWFGQGAINLSPRVPLLPLEGERFCAAFVAATVEGAEASDGSSLRQALRLLHVPFIQTSGTRPRLLAGRLFYVTGSVGGAVEREIVSEGIWCANIVMKRDPDTGQPVILALGVAPDLDGQPVSRLLLFRRREDGTWSEEVVLADRAIVDADMALAPGGDVRIVAAVAAPDISPKAHLLLIRREAGAWTATSFVTGSGDAASDRGLWARIHIDGAGRTVIVFSRLVLVLAWVVAVQDGDGWRTALIRSSEYSDVSGSHLPAGRGLLLDAPLLQAGVSFGHWVASIAPAGPNALWCAHTNGMLNLARIDLENLAVDNGVVHVDRVTGFAPALALRKNGAPAIVYKDPWGPGTRDFVDQDDLFFLSVDDGNVVPGGTRFAPVMPPYVAGGINIAGFAPHVRLDCANIINVAMLPRLLASIVMHRRTHIDIFPSDGDYPQRRLNYRRTHPGLAGLVEGVRRRPSLMIIRLSNEDFADEEIEEIDITNFADPLCTVSASFAADLDMRMVSQGLGVALAREGIVLHKQELTVQVLGQGNAWDVTDSSAFALSIRVFPQVYQIRRKNADELEVRIPPVLSVIDRAGARDSLGRPSACGQEQEFWDSVAGPFVSRFTGLPLELPDAPGRILWASIRNLHVSRYEPWDPSSEQQGAVRFTIRIPSFSARNEEPDADIYTTEPSFINFVLAPFVQDGRIRWWVREAEVRMGHVEADVDVGVFDWLKWLAVIPGVGFLLLLADPFADSYATSAINDDLKPPNPGSFQDLFVQALQGWVDDLLGPTPPPFEAVHLRNFAIRTWTRFLETDLPARSQLGVAPETVYFPAVHIGDGPVQRNLLIENAGGVPLLLENVRVTTGAPEFRLESPASWPSIMGSGESLIVTFAFEPVAPAGSRVGEVTVTFNGGRTLAVPLRGLAFPLRVAAIRVRPPEMIDFGLVTPGRPSPREVEVFNDGDASLEIALPHLEGDAAALAALSVTNPAPLSIPPRGSGVVRLAYSPPPGPATRHDARLVLESNDPAHPRTEIQLFGFTTGPGALLVMPLAVQFPDSPLDANVPALPPGVPPIVHRGQIRATTIYNTGPASLTVLASSFRVRDGAGAASPHYHLFHTDGSALAEADRVVRSGDTLLLVINFLPITAGQHDATMEIRADDLAQPVFTVTITGRGLA